MAKKTVDKLIKNCTFDADTLLTKKRTIIPLSPELDKICGGLMDGTFMMITGLQKYGKTALALWCATQCQKYGYTVDYHSIEHRLQKRDLNIEGFDPSKFKIIESTDKDFLSAEDHLLMLDHKARTEKNKLFIVDSFSMMARS